MGKPITAVEAIERICLKTLNSPYEFVDFVGKWKGVSTKLKMKCKVHGVWETTSYNKFIHDGRTCPACSKVKPLTKEDVVSNVKKALESEGSIVKLVDIGAWRGCRTELHLDCSEHGQWRTTNYNKFMMGRRCPGCAKRGFDSTKSATLYILKRVGESAIKIGIANNFKSRIAVLKRETPFSFEILGTLEAHGAFVQMLEKTLHRLHLESNSASYSGFDGCTEWFVLNNDLKFMLNLLDIKWDDGNYSCHAQRDLKRVGTLYAKLD